MVPHNPNHLAGCRDISFPYRNSLRWTSSANRDVSSADVRVASLQTGRSGQNGNIARSHTDTHCPREWSRWSLYVDRVCEQHRSTFFSDAVSKRGIRFVELRRAFSRHDPPNHPAQDRGWSRIKRDESATRICSGQKKNPVSRTTSTIHERFAEFVMFLLVFLKKNCVPANRVQ